MSRRSRPYYRLGLGWISGVAFEDTLTRPVRLARGFTFVRCCGSPRASSPHGLAAPGHSRLSTADPACSCLRLAVATNSPRKGLPPPIQCPCQAHLRAPQYARQDNSPGLHGPFLLTRLVHFHAAIWHILSPPLTLHWQHAPSGRTPKSRIAPLHRRLHDSNEDRILAAGRSAHIGVRHGDHRSSNAGREVRRGFAMREAREAPVGRQIPDEVESK